MFLVIFSLPIFFKIFMLFVQKFYTMQTDTSRL